jgi:hypothetical protein
MFCEFHRAPPRLVFLGNKASSNHFAPTSSVRPPAPRRPRRLGSAPLAGVVGRHLGFLPLHRLGLLDAIAFTWP